MSTERPGPAPREAEGPQPAVPWEFEVEATDGVAGEVLERATIRERIYTRALPARHRVRPLGPTGPAGPWQLLGELPEFAEVLHVIGEDADRESGARRIKGWARGGRVTEPTLPPEEPTEAARLRLDEAVGRPVEALPPPRRALSSRGLLRWLFHPVLLGGVVIVLLTAAAIWALLRVL